LRQGGLPMLAIGLRINPYEYRCQKSIVSISNKLGPMRRELVLGAEVGTFLRFVLLLRGALRHAYERHPQRRPQRRQHERESPDRRSQQNYLHHYEGGDRPTSPDHRGGGDLEHIEQDGRRYGGEAPTGCKADQGDEVRSLDPPLDPLAEGDGRQQERQDSRRSLYQGHRKPTRRVVECLEVREGPEVPTQDAEGEHAYERRQPYRDPEPRT